MDRPLARLLSTRFTWTDADAVRRREDTVLLLLTLVIGAVVGLVVVGFILLTEHLGTWFYPEAAGVWRRLLVPTLGALVAGVLLYRYFPAARGSGIPQTKTALFLHEGYISLKTVVGKFGCSGLSLASGIALGREGPSVHIGAGIASVLGRRLGLRPAQVKTLVPVGSAAALAAAFNTPIAAVLFTLEEVMGDLHAPVLGSIVLSSATSWMVLHLVLGDEPLFHVPAYQLVHPIEFLVYALLGIVGGLVSVSFVKLLLWLRRWFLRLPERTVWLQPAAGGLLVGLLALVAPAVVGVGYSHVGDALNARMAMSAMAILLVLKLVATATCYASGNAGGIFGPSLFLGAMMGGAVGSAAHTLLPDFTGGVGAYALVGMGTAFAGIIRVPFTSAIMIFEITRDYSIIVPVMIANLVSYFISARFQPEPIYEALQHQDGIHLPKGRAGREDRLVISEAMREPATTIPASCTVADAVSRLRAAAPGARRSLPPYLDPTRRSWPVTDEGGLVGILSAEDLERAMADGLQARAVGSIVADARRAPTATTPAYLHLDDSLDTALRHLADAGTTVLPVVGRDDVRKLVGTVSVEDVLAAYGLGPDRPVSREEPSRGSPGTLIARVAVTVTVVLAMSGGIAYYYREERLVNGQRYLAAGHALLEQKRTIEAIQQYRSALAISGSNDTRLALADGLVEVGRAAEATIYYREVLRTDPSSGRANLGLARVAVAMGDTDEAVLDYNRAAVGRWPDSAERHRVETRFELVDVLIKAGRITQATGQLLELEQHVAADVEAKRRIGRRFLELGAAKEAADVFSDILRTNPEDGPAFAGLGDAAFSQADYRSALRAYRQANRLDPADGRTAARLALCEQVAALDPSVRGISAAERHARSLAILGQSVARLDACVAASPTPGLDPPVKDGLDAARAALHDRRRPRSLSDATERDIELATRVWQAWRTRCGSAGHEDALDLILARLSG